MKFARWTDHLPAWLAYGAVATTGIYEPWEIAWMAVPLVVAAGTEAARLDLGRWRRWLQALLILILVVEVPILRKQSAGLLAIIVHMLFMLMGLRLALPREMAQRRQLLLMGFLLFLTTAVSTADLAFMGWALAWVAGASIVLLQQAWEPSALLRRGPTPAPPYARSLRWTLACLCMAGGFFIFLPRITLGLRPLPWSVSSFMGSAAGLSDTVDLGRAGPISGNADIVMRLQPPQGTGPEQIPALAERLALLRGVVLEKLDGAKWERLALTPRAPLAMVPIGIWPGLEPPLEINLEPSATPILALPYNDHPTYQSPRGIPLTSAEGEAIRWLYPQIGRQYLNVFGLSRGVDLKASFLVREPPPFGQRRAILLYTGSDGPVAQHFADQAVPAPVPPRQLAERLTLVLRRFNYTLDNPSGGAVDPIADFLENTRAGHCEYFATSLALMLRSRGVFARVVNGYRLGPWSSEGGYFLVTQNEAHSWVEYYDPEAQVWRVADPTPAMPPNTALTQGFMGAVQRWMDAVRFRWDRHVVRFTGEDQAVGFDWATARLSALGRPASWKLGGLKGAAGFPPKWWSLSILAAGSVGLLWLTRSKWRKRFGLSRTEPTGLLPLKPLLRRTRRRVPPLAGETLRAWVLRLAREQPEREAALRSLAAAAESVAYAGAADQELRHLVRSEVTHWKD